MIDNIFGRNETTAQCHVRVNDMGFGRYFCRPGFNERLHENWCMF